MTQHFVEQDSVFERNTIAVQEFWPPYKVEAFKVAWVVRPEEPQDTWGNSCGPGHRILHSYLNQFRYKVTVLFNLVQYDREQSLYFATWLTR